ncbi:MAG: FGGY-family carbohydrate kinase [Eubacteriales bacterium]|nr:FGGY-family carbohydrate kinase [Eubacteriales bacterium]
MKYLLAHDMGTSGNKATLFSEQGELIVSFVYPYKTNFFNGNWVEQDPADWWDAICKTTKMITKAAPSAEIAAVSFSGNTMGCLCVDKNGEPLRPSIIWADQRAVAEAAEIGRKISEQEFFRITGNRISPVYSLAKFLWVKNNQPQIYVNTYKILNSKDYIIHKMTGRFVTDPSIAGLGMGMDIWTRKWSDELIEKVGLDFDMFPELLESTSIVGGVNATAAEQMGLPAGIPVVCGGGDGACASVGANATCPGTAYCCMGSSSWIQYTGKDVYEPEDRRKLINVAGTEPGTMHVVGAMQAFSLSYSWMCDELCAAEKLQAQKDGMSVYDLINEQIASVAPGSDGLLFLPYLLGERCPWWNPDAKGVFLGIEREHKHANLLRAVMEGTVYNLNLIIKSFKEIGADFNELTVIGGSAMSRVWRQIMADIFEMDIVKLNIVEESSSLGAAVMAGIGAGIFKDYSTIDLFIEKESVERPNSANFETYRNMQEIFEESYHALTGIFNKLSVI